MSSPRTDDRAVRRRRMWRRARLITRYVVLSTVGFTMVLPFIWMVSTSLKTEEAAVEIPPRWVPREEITLADIDGRETPAHVLKETTTVKRLDNGETVEVYSQAVKRRRSSWLPWSDEIITANIPAGWNEFEHDVPVEIVSSAALVRIIEKDERLNELVTLRPDDVATVRPVKLHWSNYPTTWNKLPFGRSYINTTIMSVTITLGQLVTCSLAAFAFARLRFPGRDKLFFGYLATMMIPGAVTLIPVYVLFIKMPELFNWLFGTDWFARDLYFLGRFYAGRLLGGNSYFALIAPGLFSAYGTFMLRQFFMNLPGELEDAARIDGCGNLRVYWHVTIPLSKVALATLGTFTFMGTWKAFMWPLIIINREELLPLQVLLQRFRGQYEFEYTLLMAGSIIVLAPMLVVFLFGQKYFI
ncbi:MAG: carbohydrate ABC transporter permease, partial [Planctomycetota bacterium]